MATRATAPKVDGKLDDEVWARATPTGSFRQRDPEEGAAGTERTEVRVLYDDEALFVGVRAFDSRPDQISAPLARRDESPPSDWIGILIDSYFDRRTAFEFVVNPAGVKQDTYHFNDGELDPTWDAIWQVGVTRGRRRLDRRVPDSLEPAQVRRQPGPALRVQHLAEDQPHRRAAALEADAEERAGRRVALRRADRPHRAQAEAAARGHALLGAGPLASARRSRAIRSRPARRAAPRWAPTSATVSPPT